MVELSYTIFKAEMHSLEIVVVEIDGRHAHARACRPSIPRVTQVMTSAKPTNAKVSTSAKPTRRLVQVLRSFK